MFLPGFHFVPFGLRAFPATSFPRMRESRNQSIQNSCVTGSRVRGDDEMIRLSIAGYVMRSAPDYQSSSAFRSTSLTCFGLALPCVAFITWPTKKPNTFC